MYYLDFKRFVYFIFSVPAAAPELPPDHDQRLNKDEVRRMVFDLETWLYGFILRQPEDLLIDVGHLLREMNAHREIARSAHPLVLVYVIIELFFEER